VEDGLFPALAARSAGIHGFRWNGYWMDVGTPEHYRQVNLDLSTHIAPDGVVIGDSTTFDARAAAQAPAVVGAGCHIAPHATIGRSVLWDHVTIGEGSTVRDAVLASGVTTGAQVVIDGAIVAHDVTIGHGAHLGPHARIEPGTVISAGERVGL
jgi:NDP-sugar pyrophosphorylase family protein